MITGLSVVEDARAKSPDGAWTFGHLIRKMAKSDSDGAALIKAWLSTWNTPVPENINSFKPDPRSGTNNPIVQLWMKADGAKNFASWKPNLDHAPFHLLAIVYRPDLARVGSGQTVLDAGEGRFVFEPADQSGNAIFGFTAIFEYGLVASRPADIKRWAEQWHSLGSIQPGENYNKALQAITEKFSGRNSDPKKPNGNSLDQIRTNEVMLGSPWQLREFHLSKATGFLNNAPVFQTPSTLADRNAVDDYVNSDAANIKKGVNIVPSVFHNKPLIGGTSDVVGNNSGFFWTKGKIADNDVRHLFSKNTCNGCHNGETGASDFRHIKSRAKAETATVSGFLSGIEIKDPVSGAPRKFNDLLDRAQALIQALALPSGAGLQENLRAGDLSIARSRQSRGD